LRLGGDVGSCAPGPGGFESGGSVGPTGLVRENHLWAIVWGWEGQFWSLAGPSQGRAGTLKGKFVRDRRFVRRVLQSEIGHAYMVTRQSDGENPRFAGISAPIGKELSLDLGLDARFLAGGIPPGIKASPTDALGIGGLVRGGRFGNRGHRPRDGLEKPAPDGRARRRGRELLSGALPGNVRRGRSLFP